MRKQDPYEGRVAKSQADGMSARDGIPAAVKKARQCL
jgi:hypothetical protein